jgi:hypothetical protein
MKAKTENRRVDYVSHELKQKMGKVDLAPQKFKLEGGKLLLENGNLAPLAETFGGMVQVFAMKGDGMEYVDLRRLSEKRIARDGKPYGYVTIRSERTRVELERVETLGGLREIGIARESSTRFAAPLPLENKEDRAEWTRRGFDGSLGFVGWARLLGWSGAGAREAAKQVRKRWVDIGMGLSLLSPCPLVVFPETQSPTRDGLEERLAAMESRIAQLETLARFDP